MADVESMKLSEEQIYECLKSLNVPVRIKDLKTPTSEFIIDVFQIFLKDLEINISSPMMRPFEAIRHIDNPELSEYAQMLIILSATMTEILGIISNQPQLMITISDLAAPKPKKTKKILNYLIIFWNYYLKKYDMFRETEIKLKPEIQKVLDLTKEIENIEERYEEYASQLKNQSASFEELNRLYGNRHKHEMNLEKKRAGVLEGYQQLKKDLTNILTDISNKDLEIVTAKESLSELDQLIISSPEKIGADVQKIKDSVRDLEEKMHAKEVDRNEFKKLNQSVLSTQEELSKYCNKQQKLLEEIQSLTEDVQNIYSIEQKCVEEQRKLEESKSAIEMKETMLKFYAQKLSTIQQSSEQETEKILETIQSLQRQISDEEKLSKEFEIVETQLKEKIDKTACCVIDVVEKSKKSTADTKRIKDMYKKEKQNMNKRFSENCKEMLDELKQHFAPE